MTRESFMKEAFHKYALRAAVAALSVAICLFCGCGAQEPEQQAQPTEPAVTEALPLPTTEVTVPPQTTEPPLPEGVIAYDGKYYRMRDDQLRILVMGLDKKDRKEASSGFTNRMQADFLLLVVMDKNTKACDVLILNRDTMTTIRKLGFGGAVTGSYTGQLALAHTHGRGGKDSANNVIWSVSNLLGGVPIDHYMSLTMSSISRLNDLVGGVTVTILEDFTAEDPALVKGKEVTLTGKQAMIYVRGRRNVGDGTNMGRMERQKQYLYAFYKQFMAKNDKLGVEFLSRLLMSVGTSFQSDLDFEGLNELRKILPDCKLNPFQYVAGEQVMGETFYEYYPDEQALQAQIISLFYEEVSLEEG